MESAREREKEYIHSPSPLRGRERGAQCKKRGCCARAASERASEQKRKSAAQEETGFFHLGQVGASNLLLSFSLSLSLSFSCCTRERREHRELVYKQALSLSFAENNLHAAALFLPEPERERAYLLALGPGKKRGERGETRNRRGIRGKSEGERE